MLLKSILIGFIGILCIFDPKLFGRINIERPLITCTLVGLILGDVQTGLAIGATLELMSLGLVTIGAATPINMNFAAIIAASIAIMTNAPNETAITLSIPIAVLGQLIGMLVHISLAGATHVADRAIDVGKFNRVKHMHIVVGLTINAIAYFIPIFVAVYFGTQIIGSIVDYIPDWLNAGLALSTKFLTAYGLSLLLSIMLKKELIPFFALGFFAVAYFNLSITSIAIFATILVTIMASLKFTDNLSNKGGFADIDILEDEL